MCSHAYCIYISFDLDSGNPKVRKLYDVDENLRALYHQRGLSSPEHLVPPGIEDAWRYYKHLLQQKKEQEDAVLVPGVERERALQRFEQRLSQQVSSQLRAQQTLESARDRLDVWVAT